MKSFPVKNAGNICVQVSFSFDSKTDLFSLKPNSAVLPPGGDVQLTVEFQPALTATCPLDQPISNLILMNVSVMAGFLACVLNVSLLYEHGTYGCCKVGGALHSCLYD